MLEKEKMNFNLDLDYTGFEEFLVERNPKFGDGVHYIFKFENGYGASVLKGYGTYGYEEDLWELAVITFEENGEDYYLVFDTKIASDVLGHLTDERVREVLKEIKDLTSDTDVIQTKRVEEENETR